MSSRQIKCVDFFCGGGGMSWGLSEAGIEVIGALDNDLDCRETYEANHPGTKLMMRDITKMNPKELGLELGIKQDDDNLLFVGCSPCQYWSVITGKLDSGRKHRASRTRNLLMDFTSFVAYYRPGFVLLENVRGLTRNAEDSGLAALKRFFDSNGYEYESDILEAAKHGVPQSRSRYVLIASRVEGTKDRIKLPEPTPDVAVVRDHIHGLPDQEAGAPPPPNDPLHRSSWLSQTNIERLKLTPEGGMRKHWADEDELMIDAYRGKATTFFRENYGRMSWDKPAPTITTRFNSIGCGRFGHPEQNRAISLREGALLQTFPKEYEFKTKAFGATAKLIGNAVPPALAKRLGNAILAATK